MRIRVFGLLLLCSGLAVSGLVAGPFDPASVAVRPDQVYGHKYGLALTYDVFTPRNADGAAVVFINSGGYVSGQFRQCEETASGWAFVPIEPIERWGLPRLLTEQYGFEKLLAAGFTVFDVRVGSSPKFAVDEMFADCARAVRHIKSRAKDYRIDPARVGLWGGSAGGHLALLTAARVVNEAIKDERVVGAFEANGRPEPAMDADNGVRAVGVYYPAGYDFVQDKKDFPVLSKELPALAVADDVLAAASIKTYLGPKTPPVLIVYGDKDFPFIVGASRAIAADLEARSVEAKTIVIPGVAHEFKGPDGYKDDAPGRKAMTALVEWFEAKLRG